MTGNTNFKKKLTSFASKFVRASEKNRAMKVKIAAEILRHVNWPVHSRRWSNGWAIFRSCCFSTVLWTTVMNENNNQRCHFLKYLFENPNVSVLQWNALYNFSVMCPILIDTPENYTTKLSRIWACFLKKLLEFIIISKFLFYRNIQNLP